MTDEAAQLAREIVEFANRWTPFDGSAINDVCAGALPELLRTALAAKDAEIERLREAAEASLHFMKWEDKPGNDGPEPSLSRSDIKRLLRAALQQGESHAG